MRLHLTSRFPVLPCICLCPFLLYFSFPSLFMNNLDIAFRRPERGLEIPGKGYAERMLGKRCVSVRPLAKGPEDGTLASRRHCVANMTQSFFSSGHGGTARILESDIVGKLIFVDGRGTGSTCPMSTCRVIRARRCGFCSCHGRWSPLGLSLISVESAVCRTRTSLGHAAVPNMRRMLQAATAPQAVRMLCYSCSLTAPNIQLGVTVPHTFAPWTSSGCQAGTIKSVNIVDEASNLQQIYPYVETEASEVLLRRYRRWTRAYGRPRWLKVGASRTHGQVGAGIRCANDGSPKTV